MCEKEKEIEIETQGAFPWEEKLRLHIPILTWLPRHKKMDFIADVIAGLTVGLTLIPQSVAYAGLAGLSPEMISFLLCMTIFISDCFLVFVNRRLLMIAGLRVTQSQKTLYHTLKVWKYGLYSSFMGSFIYAIFGTIKEVSMGPNSLLSLLTYEFTKDLPLEFVFLLTFMCGCVEMLLGLLRFGFLVNFISIPVTTSFQSATALIIISSQLKDLLGVPKFKSGRFFSNIAAVAERIKETRTNDLVLSIFCCTFLLLLRKLKDVKVSKNKELTENEKILKKALWFISISRNAICVFISCIMAYTFSLYGKSPFKLSGNIPAGLPPFQPPHFSIQNGNETWTFTEAVYEISSGIFVIPLISVLANVTIAKAFSTGSPVNATQEMITLGLCNISGSFVGSLPTCGAFTRSAVSNSSGVRSPLAGIFTGTLIVLVIRFLTPCFYYIPRATLASILVCAVVFMIDWKTIYLLWKVNKTDFLSSIITFSACLIFGIQTGLLCGIVINTGHLLYLWARPSVSVQLMTTTEGNYYKVTVDIGLYFPATDFIRNTITSQCVQSIPIVVDCLHFKGIDYTTARAIKELAEQCKKKGQKLVFINISFNVCNFLKNTNIDISLKRWPAQDEDLYNILFYAEEQQLLTAVLLESDSKQMEKEVNPEGKPLLKH